MRAIAYEGPRPSRPGRVGLPNAEVRVAQHDDGRWMWGVSFSTTSGGEGFAPLPKWGRFADTEEAAIAAGLEEICDRMARHCWANTAQVRVLLDWARALAAPAQGELFGAAA